MYEQEQAAVPYKWLHLISFILGVLCCLLLYSVVSQAEVTQALDDAVLLEKQQPGYTDHLLLPQRARTISVLQSTADITDRRNLLVNTLSSYQSANGYTITVNSDGSVTFSGTNQSEDVAYISIGTLSLADGDYILSDGGSSVQDEIFLYFQGMSYDIGGQTNYTTLARMPEQSRFTTDHTTYSEYNCSLRVPAGYTSSGITFYPMLQAADHFEEAYEPCITTSVSLDGQKTYQYSLLSMDKSALDEITPSDWQLFRNNIRYNVITSDWATIDFLDGTGLEFDRDGTALYGKLLATGKIEAPGNAVAFHDTYTALVTEGEEASVHKANGINGIDDTNVAALLSEITNFSTYLDKLAEGKERYTILLSVRDEGVGALTDIHREKLAALGLQADFSDMYRYSYAAVIENGQVQEKNSPDEEVTLAGTTGTNEMQEPAAASEALSAPVTAGTTYEIKSAGYTALQNGGSCSIVVDGLSYAMNRRGMNFVVLENGKVIDTVAFDTCSGLKSYRPLHGIVGITP